MTPAVSHKDIKTDRETDGLPAKWVEKLTGKVTSTCLLTDSVSTISQTAVWGHKTKLEVVKKINSDMQTHTTTNIPGC